MKTPTLEEEADEFLNVMTIVERFKGRGENFSRASTAVRDEGCVLDKKRSIALLGTADRTLLRGGA